MKNEDKIFETIESLLNFYESLPNNIKLVVGEKILDKKDIINSLMITKFLIEINIKYKSYFGDRLKVFE